MHGIPISSVAPFGASESVSFVGEEYDTSIASSALVCSSAGSGGNVPFVTTGDLPLDGLPLDVMVSLDRRVLSVAVELVLSVFLCWSERSPDAVAGLEPPCLSFPLCGRSSFFFCKPTDDFPVELVVRSLATLPFFSLAGDSEVDGVDLVLAVIDADFLAVIGEPGVKGRFRSIVGPDTLRALEVVIVLIE